LIIKLLKITLTEWAKENGYSLSRLSND
jgi:hypothetical protein